MVIEKEYHAFVGSRDLSDYPINLIEDYRQEVRKSVCRGAIISTGAAEGADQMAANEAVLLYHPIRLCLPWKKYELIWRNQVAQFYPDNGVRHIEEIIYSRDAHPQAHRSIFDHHPNPAALSQGVLKLMGRNYLIVEGCTRLVALCRVDNNGEPMGGTAQAIRIARSMSIDVKLLHK